MCQPRNPATKSFWQKKVCIPKGSFLLVALCAFGSGTQGDAEKQPGISWAASGCVTQHAILARICLKDVV